MQAAQAQTITEPRSGCGERGFPALGHQGSGFGVVADVRLMQAAFEGRGSFCLNPNNLSRKACAGVTTC